MKSIFKTPEQKTQEWALASSLLITDGQLKANGTKVRRKDHKALEHSFIVLDGQILAIGRVVLGRGKFGAVKLSENSEGDLRTIKIFFKHPYPALDSSSYESIIGQDLGISGEIFDRQSNGPKRTSAKSTKYYMASKYLGETVYHYLATHFVDDRSLYLLVFHTSLLFHRLRHGKLSLTGQGYTHHDAHLKNILRDPETGQYSLIDFGQSFPIPDGSGPNPDSSKLITNNFSAFFRGLLGNLKREFWHKLDPAEKLEKKKSLYSKTDRNRGEIIHFYFKKEDSVPNRQDRFQRIHYLLPLPNGGFAESSIDLAAHDNIKHFFDHNIFDNPFMYFTPEEKTVVDTIIQQSIASEIKKQETRKPHSVIQDLYSGDDESLAEKAQKESSLSLANACLLSALGMTDSIGGTHQYKQSSGLDLDDYLEILSHQDAYLDLIYQVTKQQDPEKKELLVRQVHHGIFDILNDETPNTCSHYFNKIKALSQKSDDKIYDTLEKIHRTLLTMKKNKINDYTKIEARLQALREKEARAQALREGEAQAQALREKEAQAQALREEEAQAQTLKKAEARAQALEKERENAASKKEDAFKFVAAVCFLPGLSASIVGFVGVGGVVLGTTLAANYAIAFVGLAVCIISIVLASMDKKQLPCFKRKSFLSAQIFAEISEGESLSPKDPESKLNH